MTPLVSVLLPIAGEKLYLAERAIDSIINQTLKNIELICIQDDPDNIKLTQILRRYSESSSLKIKILINETKIGIAESLNRGIKVSEGKYLARMDSDDESLPTRLETQFNFMESNPKIALVGMQALETNEEGIILGKTMKPFNHDQISQYSRFACPIIHPTWFIRADILRAYGGYLNISPAQDYHLITKMIRGGHKLHNIDQIGIKYTVSNASLSRMNVYKTIAVTNLIRKSMRLKINLDEFILQAVASQKYSRYFNFIYRIRSIGLGIFKRKGYGNKLLGSFLTIIISFLHPKMLLDTWSLMQIHILRIKWALKK